MLRYIFYLLVGLVLMWVGGFCYFIYGLSQEKLPSNEKTDGIVVLTGGKSRLTEAVRLLEQGMATKLFISGVNDKVTDEELLLVLGSSRALADCCIESGTQAKNTVGNAREITGWVTESHISSIRVVTSLEHMPRTLLEMRQFMPKMHMVAHPVGQWKPENIRFVSLAREYSKYLVSLFRNYLVNLGA